MVRIWSDQPNESPINMSRYRILPTYCFICWEWDPLWGVFCAAEAFSVTTVICFMIPWYIKLADGRMWLRCVSMPHGFWGSFLGAAALSYRHPYCDVKQPGYNQSIQLFWKERTAAPRAGRASRAVDRHKPCEGPEGLESEVQLLCLSLLQLTWRKGILVCV